MPTFNTMDALISNPYTGITSKFSQSFQLFVKELGDAKSKAEEDRIISREILYLKETVTKPGITSKILRECIVRLIHCEMLGHDASFAYMEAVKFAQQQNLLEKRVAYVALGQFLDEKNETERMMNMSSIQRDLKSTNIMQVCFGLIAASKLVYKDMLPAVLPAIAELMKHKREVVRKKAVMTMFKFYVLDSKTICSSGYLELFHSALCDKDPAVMGASLNAYHKFITDTPSEYKHLTSSFVTIWKQILNRKLPEDFNHRAVPSPWMQIKLLQILGLLGCDDMTESKKMYEILRQCLDVTDTEQTIGCAVVYECMKTIATIYPNRALVEAAANKAGLFLVASNYNLKYLGITTLSSLIHVDISYATRHQMIVIDCLNDQDESLKWKTSDLLYRMTNASNVKVICERLISSLRSTVDDYVKSDLVTRITTLAEKYSPDNEWFINTMNDVFELGGDLVQVEVAYNMMRIIGEGIDDEDSEEDETDDLRRNAVISYVDLMGKSSLPDILIQLICWVVGEYIDLLQDYDIEDVLDKFYQMLSRRFSDPITQSWVVSAIMKILVATKQPQKYFREVKNVVLTNDAHQRYVEMKAMFSTCNDLENVVPYDASCTEMEIDSSLSFLDAFVNDALQKGASPYSTENKRSMLDEAADEESTSSLVYGAYPKPSVYRVFKQDTPSSVPNEMNDTIMPPASSTGSSSRPGSGKAKLWTRDGLSKNRVTSDSSSSDISTPPSSISGSVNTEEKTDSGQEKDTSTKVVVSNPVKTLDPDEERKKKMADELFGISTPQKSSKKSLSSRDSKVKPRKRTGKKEDKQPVPDLLDISDLNEPTRGALLQDNSNTSVVVEQTERILLKTSTEEDFSSLPPETQQGTASTEELFADMTMSNENTTQDPIPSLNVVSKDMVTKIGTINLMDEDDLPIQTLPNNILMEQTSITNHIDVNKLTIPDELSQYPNSQTQTEICKDINLRVMCQHVYHPTQLAIILYVLNQSAKPVTDVRLVVMLPSNLRAESSESKVGVDSLQGLDCYRSTMNVQYQSPAQHMVLTGHVMYRDSTNTEKRLFINQVVHMSSLLRPSKIDIKAFETKWLDRTLYEKKEKLNRTFNMDQLNLFLESMNIHPVQGEGSQVVCATTVLSKYDILLHFKITSLQTEVWLKSGSKLLNECVMKMLTSAK